VAVPPPQPLAGTLIDYTHNHGADRRIWSPALDERRDLYVYLPPGFDPNQQYPLLIWLHGITNDEQAFTQDGLVVLDAAMAAGRLPPLLIAIPDGSLRGRSQLLGAEPLFINSRLGRFEDYVTQDIWDFVVRNYPVRPEREAHVLGGFSGGGAGAYRLAIKYRERFAVVFGISPPLNLRWQDCHGRYFGNFDPSCWGWRTRVRGREPVGRFYGIIPIRLRELVYPLFGRGSQALESIRWENPIEMLDFFQVLPGELAMYVAYGGRDEFNIDAQVESFLYRARQLGLCVRVGYDPAGRHTLRWADRMLPGVVAWLAPLLAPYAPAAGETILPGSPCPDRTGKE